jgi:hypothetical protein
VVQGDLGGCTHRILNNLHQNPTLLHKLKPRISLPDLPPVPHQIPLKFKHISPRTPNQQYLFLIQLLIVRYGFLESSFICLSVFYVVPETVGTVLEYKHDEVVCERDE